MPATPPPSPAGAPRPSERAPAPLSGDHTIAIGAATRPYPGETANGDAWAVHWHAGLCRITLVDGLGHGPLAAHAAQAALTAVAARPRLAPDDAIRACHAALGGTRGAGVTIVQLDPAAGQLVVAGVGNVEGCLWPGGGRRPRHLLVQRGIVGSILPRVRTDVHDLAPGWLLLLHTDGVQQRCEPETLPSFTAREPQTLAGALVARWGRATDDATAVVALATAHPQHPHPPEAPPAAPASPAGEAR